MNFGLSFWSILVPFGGLGGRLGGLWGAKMAPKVPQEASKTRSKMRHGIGGSILTKKLLFLEPQKDFEESTTLDPGAIGRPSSLKLPPLLHI